MHKKALALIMVLAMVLLAGCNGGGTPSTAATASTAASTPATASSSAAAPVVPEGATVVRIWHYFSGAPQTTLAGIVKSFNDGPGKDSKVFVIEENQGVTADLEKKIQTASESGVNNLPEIVHGYPDIMATLNAKGQLADLGSHLTDEQKAAYYESFLKEGSQFGDDKLRLMPIAKSTELLFINRTLWDSVKGEIDCTDDDLQTWEGIAKAGKAYAEKYEKPFFVIGSYANFFYLTGYQQGVEYIHADGTATLDRDAAKRSYDFIAAGLAENWMAIKDAQFQFSSDFINVGNAVCYVDSNSGATYVTPRSVADSTAPEEKLDFMTYPVWEDVVNRAVIQQGAGMALVKKGEAVEKAAAMFLAYMTNVANTTAFSMGSGYIPVQKDTSSNAAFAAFLNGKAADGKDLDAKTLKVSGAVRTAIEQFDSYTMYYTPAFDGSNLIRRDVDDEIKKVFTGSTKDFDTFYNALEAAFKSRTEGR